MGDRHMRHLPRAVRYWSQSSLWVSHYDVQAAEFLETILTADQWPQQTSREQLRDSRLLRLPNVLACSRLMCCRYVFAKGDTERRLNTGFKREFAGRASLQSL
jgi:hypothetical protein